MKDPEAEVVTELRKMARLLAVGLLQGTQREKIQRLSAAHFAPKEIAEILGVPLNIVTSDISKFKKAKGAKAKADS